MNPAATAPRGALRAPTSRFAAHIEAGISPFSGLAPTAARATSLGDTLDAEVKQFAARTGNGFWPSLPRALVAARLTTLLRDPTGLNQAGLNACGSAAAMYLFAKRRREQFARFAIDLYESGAGRFGSLEVSGDGLQHKDPAKMAWGAGLTPHGLDWMVLSALQRSESAIATFDGEPSDAFSGITMPGEMEGWLRDGVGYKSVDNEANKFITRDLDHLRRLAPSADLDVVVLVNLDVITGGSKKSTKSTKSKSASGMSGAVQRGFPNHWFVLEAPVQDNGAEIVATAWTWGNSGYPFAGTQKGWDDGYYGAIRAQVGA